MESRRGPPRARGTSGCGTRAATCPGLPAGSSCAAAGAEPSVRHACQRVLPRSPATGSCEAARETCRAAACLPPAGLDPIWALATCCRTVSLLSSRRACQMYDSNTFTASHPACRKVRSSASVNAQAPTPAGRQILSYPSVGTQHPPTLHVTECTRPAPCADPPHTLRATPRTCTECTRPRCARPRCFPARSGACPTAQARYGRPRGRARRRLPRLRIHSYSGARCVLRAAVRPSPRPQSNRC